jgi:hypothetical protein
MTAERQSPIAPVTRALEELKAQYAQHDATMSEELKARYPVMTFAEISERYPSECRPSSRPRRSAASAASRAVL